MQDIKELIKYEYENGNSIRVLAEKYNQKVGTIKSWISREKWVKKKENVATSKKKNATIRRNHLKKVANDKDLQIKKDLINNIPEKEIKEKYGIKKTKYYNLKKSIREIQIEKSRQVLTEIADERYSDLKNQLLDLDEEKRKLKELFFKTGINDVEVIKQIELRLKLLKEFEKEIYKGGQIIGLYRQSEIEEQLEKEKLEKAKLEKDESEKEIEMMELLRNITNKVEKDE